MDCLTGQQCILNPDCYFKKIEYIALEEWQNPTCKRWMNLPGGFKEDLQGAIAAKGSETEY